MSFSPLTSPFITIHQHLPPLLPFLLNLDSVGIHYNHRIIQALSAFAPRFLILSDLQMKLTLNTSSVPAQTLEQI